MPGVKSLAGTSISILLIHLYFYKNNFTQTDLCFSKSIYIFGTSNFIPNIFHFLLQHLPVWFEQKISVRKPRRIDDPDQLEEAWKQRQPINSLRTCPKINTINVSFAAKTKNRKPEADAVVHLHTNSNQGLSNYPKWQGFSAC